MKMVNNDISEAIQNCAAAVNKNAIKTESMNYRFFTAIGPSNITTNMFDARDRFYYN